MSLTSVFKLSLIPLLIFLVACSSPQRHPNTPNTQPPTVDLTGIWTVTIDLEGFRRGPYTWVILQSGSRVATRTYDPDALDTPNTSNTRCGQDVMSSISGDRWRISFSFKAENCPVYAPRSGSFSYDIRATRDAFEGSITFTVTSPASSAGTSVGRITGTD